MFLFRKYQQKKKYQQPDLFKAYISKFSRIAQAEMLHLFICIFFQDVLEETFENETEFSNSLKHVLQNLFVTIAKNHIETEKQ